jgi:hypothetical protein
MASQDSVTSTSEIMSRARNAVFTINNYTDDSVRSIQEYFESGNAKYVILGFEVAPTSGTPHIQGYIQFSKPTKVGPLAKKWKAWFKRANGNDQENFNYCSKGGRFMEFGERRDTTGASSGHLGGLAEQDRWKRNIKLAKKGMLEELAEVDPEAFTRCHRTYKQIAVDYMVPPEDLPTLRNYWIWGATGTGKSRSAREWCSENNFTMFRKNRNKWWDGYQGQDVVIIDDWSPETECLGDYLKDWADHYSFTGETKGGNILARPKTFIVTSQFHPETCFRRVETTDAIKRRFKIHHFISYDPKAKVFT